MLHGKDSFIHSFIAFSMEICDVCVIIAGADGGVAAVALVPRGNVCRAQHWDLQGFRHACQ